MSPRDTATNPLPSTDEGLNSESESIIFKSNIEPYSHNTYEPVTVTHYVRFKNHFNALMGKESSKEVSKLYGIYRAQTIRMLKFSIHADKGELFEALSIQAISVTCQAVKKKKIRNIPGYFDGVLRNLIEKTLFKDVFMAYDVPVDWIIPE